MSTFSGLSASDLQLFEHRVKVDYLREVTRESEFSRFTGDTPKQIIFQEYQQRGHGQDITFGIRQSYFPNVIFGDEAQLTGTGKKMIFANDKVTINESAHGIMLTGQDMDEIRVNIDLTTTRKQELIDEGKMVEKCRVLNQFGRAFYGPTTAFADHLFYRYNLWPTTLIPQMLACGVDDAAAAAGVGSISSDRVIFGQDRAAGATVAASITNARLTSNDDDALTVEHIYKLVELATAGSRASNGDTVGIKPYESLPMFRWTDETFILFTSERNFARLRTTAAWQQQVTRGVIEAQGVQPSTLYNMRYKGSLIGVKIIVIPEWNNYNFLNADESTIGYSALCGQSAIVHGIGKDWWMTTETTNHGRMNEIMMNVIDGMKVLKFPSKNDLVLKQNNPLKLEYGMVHSFTMINRV